jgi:hypothetical protein
MEYIQSTHLLVAVNLPSVLDSSKTVLLVECFTVLVMESHNMRERQANNTMSHTTAKWTPSKPLVSVRREPAKVERIERTTTRLHSRRVISKCGKI